MDKNRCDFNEIFIEQYADSELDLYESSKVSSHIENCQICKQKYEEIVLTKNFIRKFDSSNKLSLIEKEGFLSFIERKSLKKQPLLSKISKYVKSHGFTVAISTLSLSIIVFAFIFSLLRIEKKNELIIKELLAAHSNPQPFDFDTSEKVESELKKIFAIDKKTFLEFASISPVLKGRSTSIATMPTTKIKMQNRDEKEEGTLFLSKKNELIKNAFEDGSCLVKSIDNHCKARMLKEGDSKMIHWEDTENDFVFVSDGDRISTQMVKLISANY
ncbi:MAG: hypothetical protein ACOX2F_11955 [bacterium]